MRSENNLNPKAMSHTIPQSYLVSTRFVADDYFPHATFFSLPPARPQSTSIDDEMMLTPGSTISYSSPPLPRGLFPRRINTTVGPISLPCTTIRLLKTRSS
ncbi:hypothetical protein ASPBRDRAFT_549016 [Aspergillus brasiliensis CBS 101740]|uniref:Uncharacterized protein n=1 Tax=Aspergillus brasiliensis (strain CBS 101740 / IMI 381727 / IBT 21946) TaxID=767769 RepID=A0A1L9ULU9_ASPBC|nr:hypothetical protein ASPBRDRAFT_549016 [Aspergillus brasiliensis CBS 101740]